VFEGENVHKQTINLAGAVAMTLLCPAISRAADNGCADLPSQSELKAALTAATDSEGSGLNMHMWATIVDRALYSKGGRLVGGVGVSGDTSCSDHNVAWRLRHNLNLDFLAGLIPGVAGVFAGDTAHPDNIIFDISPNPAGGTGSSSTGFGHPTCLKSPPAAPVVPGGINVAAGLPPVQ
jgi:hypothetical protein